MSIQFAHRTVESSELSTWLERDYRFIQKLSGCLVLTSSSILQYIDVDVGAF